MKKLALLCGLISGLYLPLQAQAEEGVYARAVCRAVLADWQNHYEHEGNAPRETSIGFGYAATPEAAKIAATENCKNNLKQFEPKYIYQDLFAGDRDTNNDNKYLLTGPAGKWICGSRTYKPAIADSKEKAMEAEGKVLTELSNYINLPEDLKSSVTCSQPVQPK